MFELGIRNTAHPLGLNQMTRLEARNRAKADAYAKQRENIERDEFRMSVPSQPIPIIGGREKLRMEKEERWGERGKTEQGEIKMFIVYCSFTFN